MSKLKQQVFVPQVLTGAFILTFVIFAGVPVLVEAEPQDVEVLREVLLGVGALLLLGGYFLKENLIGIFTGKLEQEVRLQGYIGALFQAHLISLALREAGVIMAFVVSYLSDEPVWIMSYAAIGIALNLSDFPSVERWKRYLPENMLRNEARAEEW